MAIEILNRQRRLRVDKADVARLVRAVLDMEHSFCDVSIAFVNRRSIVDLNRRYFGRGEATDVIAFPLRDTTDGGCYLGEVVVCADVAAAEAATRGIDSRNELYFYTIHGLLHLLGYTDQAPRKRTAMNARARAILRAFNRRAGTTGER